MNKIGLLFCLALLFSCEREYNDNEFLGNSLNDQLIELTINSPLSTNSQEFDFIQLPQQNFSASWSKNANYELQIIGKNSSALKSFSGFDNSLNISNTTWRGEANDFPSFEVEPCEAILTVSDQETTITDTLLFTIAEVKALQQGLYIIEDFETSQPFPFLVWPGEGPQDQDIDNAVRGEKFQWGDQMEYGITNNGNEAAKGQKYYRMRGEVSWSYLVGLVVMPVDDLPNIAPSNIFFNMAIAGARDSIYPSEQKLKIDIYETDGDIFTTDIDVNWSSWKKISIPYSEFSPSSSSALHETENIFKVRAMCLSCPSNNSNSSEGSCIENQGIQTVTDIDILSFTENEPYQP